MDEIPCNIEFLMLHDGVWQKAKELDPEGNTRWFWGEEIGAVPEDEIQDWKQLKQEK